MDLEGNIIGDIEYRKLFLIFFCQTVTYSYNFFYLVFTVFFFNRFYYLFVLINIKLYLFFSEFYLVLTKIKKGLLYRCHTIGMYFYNIIKLKNMNKAYTIFFSNINYEFDYITLYGAVMKFLCYNNKNNGNYNIND